MYSGTLSENIQSLHTLISFSCFSLWRRIKASINDFSYSECFCFLWFYHRPITRAQFGLPQPKNGQVWRNWVSTVKPALDISSFVKLASSSATSWRYMQSVSLHCWPFKNLNFMLSDELFRSRSVLVRYGGSNFWSRKVSLSGPKIEPSTVRGTLTNLEQYFVVPRVAFNVRPSWYDPLTSWIHFKAASVVL